MPQEKKIDYDYKKIESNWKEKWYTDNIYEAVDFSPKPKKYILAELPYPSGKSLHIGHAMRYTVPDMYSRYLRMRGYNVLFPMGWDAFGLPAEVHAIKNNTTPQETTKNLSVEYKKAMMDIGYAIDWSREINTTDTKYYKWTQWLFLKFYKNGLAEYKDMPVWYSQTVGILADEEVINDENGEKIAERDGSKVERKMFKQWVLKIPAYAEKLLEGLKIVDFPESIKNAQINWIGKNEGAEVIFDVYDESKQKIDQVKVFTTRPDTIFGVTFLAIAPENPLIEVLLDKSTNKEEVKSYIKIAKNRSDMERQVEKEKSGIQLKGLYAKHPFDEVDRKIPVFVTDYILVNVGTGSIMGVPAHDERDFEFAKKYELEIINVIKPKTEFPQHEIFTGSGLMVNSGQYDDLDSKEFFEKVIERLQRENKGKKAVTYKIRDWVFSRQRYWGEPVPIIHKQDGTTEALAEELLPLELPYSTDYSADENGTAPLGKLQDWVKTTDKNGNPAKRETQTMPTWAGSSWYYLRYIDPNNDDKFADFEKLKYWLPVDKYFGGAEHTTVHLLYSRFWHRFLYDLGLVPCPEPYQWRMNGGLMLGSDGKKMSKRSGNAVEPGILINNYGADATRLALVFIGPYSDTYPWNQNTIKAMWRLIKNIYESKEKVRPHKDAVIEKSYARLVKNVTNMCENLKMNTAISEIMTFVKDLKKVNTIDVDIWKGFIKLIAPFMPFLAEELWQEINEFTTWEKQNSVHLQPWPEIDNTQEEDSSNIIPVMINGKIRGQIETDAKDTEDDIKTKILKKDKISKYLNDNIKRLIFVPGKIISIQS